MIAFDIDGVVCDLESRIRKRIVEQCGYDIAAASERDYDIRVPGVSNSRIWEIIHGCLFEPDLPAYPEARSVIDKFHRELGESILFVSARPLDAKDATQAWIRNHIHVPAEVRVTPRSQDKWQLIPLNCQYFVEDKLETALDLVRHGIGMFLIDRPWNQGEITPGIIRVKDLNEVFNIMLPVISSRSMGWQKTVC
jgi:uncharacterized HAD superfamily protein